MNEKAIIEHDQPLQAIPEIQITTSPAAMVMWAIENDKGLDLIDKLMDQQDRYDNKMAKQAFDKAMAQFKADPPNVIKDKKNTQYNGSGYVSRGNLVNTVNIKLAEYGLSTTWDFDQADGLVTVTCILTHEMGHSKSVSISAPPDISGKKNPIQQIKSTKTYLEIATYESVTGVAASDDGDDDGNSTSKPVELVTDEQVLTLESRITDNGLDMARLKKWMASAVKVDDFASLNEAGYKHVMDMVDSQIKANAKREPGSDG